MNLPPIQEFRWAITYRDGSHHWHIWVDDDSEVMAYATRGQADAWAKKVPYGKSILVGSEQFCRAYFNTFGAKWAGVKTAAAEADIEADIMARIKEKTPEGGIS